MNRTSHLFVRLAVLATTVVGLVLVTSGQATARTCVVPSDASLTPCPIRSGDRYAGSSVMPVQQASDNSDRTLHWVLFAAAVLGALAIVAVVADLLARRRWRQPSLEAALAASDPEQLPRAAGLLGERFIEQDRTDAATHAFRAAIDADDQDWSPIAQVALADLLGERGDRTEAQDLLEAAIASGHPRAVPAAQASLDQLWTGDAHATATDTLTKVYETVTNAGPANRYLRRR